MGHYTSSGGRRPASGMTLVEMILAMAILVVVFAAIVPQIRAIQNSWGSRREMVEAIQNGRVLIDHIIFNLTQANKITAVSSWTQKSGYIEFEDNDGNVMRYDISSGGYIEYGPVGSLSELAGPVSELQFTCYDACDLDAPILDVSRIRSVTVRSTFTNSASLGRDQTFVGEAYLRTNSLGGGPAGLNVTEVDGSEFEFDTLNGEQPVLCQIDEDNYLCVYKGDGLGGWAVILTVDRVNWTITKGTPLEFYKDVNFEFPALARIDATDYLCVFTGEQMDGYAMILTVNASAGTVKKGPAFEFDDENCEMAAVSRINSTDFLCVYTGRPEDGLKCGWSVILTADGGSKTVTMGTPFKFQEGAIVEGCELADIDGVHHLCIYGYDEGGGTEYEAGRGVVLTTDAVAGTITKEIPFEFETVGKIVHADVCKIDTNHYLCVYNDNKGLDGQAVVLTVDTGTWLVGKGETLTFEPDQIHFPSLACINGNDFLCAYGVFGSVGMAQVFRADTQTDTVTCGPAYKHEPDKGKTPDLAKVDDTHFLCVYTGLTDDGFGVILTLESVILP
ncbi:MAG: type II secretion system protein [Planctomycetota bacterium]|nr:MAG: type II secretion system protein [Planctomycetota bacterium]